LFPLKDDIPSSRAPVVNILFITVNILIFLFEASLGPQLQPFLLTYGLVPAHFQFSHLFTSMFLHGGWAHVLGNMLYLWIFGDNVEDRLGHVGYFFFYLICGVAAGYAHVLTNAGSTVPTVGASGAIAGVLGAYLVLYPRARVLTVLPILPLTTTYIPAGFFLGIWFVLQIFSGAMQLGMAQTGGVAFLAHVGGFIAGAIFGLLARGFTRDPTQA
jgi:membrane associated rhomboid family serine protease